MPMRSRIKTFATVLITTVVAAQLLVGVANAAPPIPSQSPPTSATASPPTGADVSSAQPLPRDPSQDRTATTTFEPKARAWVGRPGLEQNTRARSSNPCPGVVEDRFNSCFSGVITADWGSGPVVPNKWYVDTIIEMRSQVNSGNVTIRVTASNGRFDGQVPNKGKFKLEFYLKDPVSPTYLPVKYAQAIEIDYIQASAGSVFAQRTVSPGLSINPEDAYRLRLGIATRGDNETQIGQYGPKVDTNVGTSVRCDGDINGLFAYRYGPNSKGCINADPEEVPVIKFPASSYFNISSNIRAAFSGGSPGQQDTGRPLHRATDTKQESNYKASCGDFARRFAEIGDPPAPTTTVPVWNCDEYPFASSNEGGAYARMKWVPKSENDRQGSDLREMYVKYRVPYGDAYEVSAPADE